MRRPDIELTDNAARFVELHPDLIARLAGERVDTESLDPEWVAAKRARIRERIRERLTEARAGSTQGAGEAFLARFAGR